MLRGSSDDEMNKIASAQILAESNINVTPMQTSINEGTYCVSRCLKWAQRVGAGAKRGDDVFVLFLF